MIPDLAHWQAMSPSERAMLVRRTVQTADKATDRLAALQHDLAGLRALDEAAGTHTPGLEEGGES